MTIEDKLQHFYELSVGEADASAQAIVQKHKDHLTETLGQHKKDREQDAGNQIRAESENAKREVNKALSAEHLTLKRQVSARENELKDRLFVEVKNLLTAFMSTGKYEEYLERKIREAVSFAQEDELFIYLTPEDESLQHALAARTGFPVQIAKEPFVGGIRAEIPSKNILIDSSFAGALHTMRKEFNFDGGPKA